MVAKGEIRSDGEPVGPALAHSAYVTAHQHEAARMIRDPGARISIMARAAADAAHPTGRIYDRNRSTKRPLLTACTRAGSIYDTKIRLHKKSDSASLNNCGEAGTASAC